MSKLYDEVAHEYYRLAEEKRELIYQRSTIIEKLNMIVDKLEALDSILCRYGTHVYEHFEEDEEDNCTESED